MSFDLWTKARSLAGSTRGRAIAVAILAVAVAAPLLVLGGGTEAQRERRSPPPAGDPNGPDIFPTVSPSASAPATVSGRWNGYGAWRAHAGPDGTLGDEMSYRPSMSANGRWVAFASSSSNLVKGDTNREGDVFVKDRATGKTTRVSVSSSGRQSNGWSGNPQISANGRYIGFVSQASNLVPGDTNRCTHFSNSEVERCPDVFVHDQLTRKTVRVSVSSSGTQANGASDRGVAISADGRYVAFSSAAKNLVSGDTNRKTDIFLHDRSMGTTSRLSVTPSGAQTNGNSFDPSISSDGSRVLFISHASNLDPRGARTCSTGDRPATCSNVFLRDIRAGTTSTIVWTAQLTHFATLSGDGRFVAFTSIADDLVPGDTNGKEDAFVYEIANARTTRVSVSSAEEQGNGSVQGSPAISPDGRYVAFAATSSNLVPNDREMCEDIMEGTQYNCWDILIRDRSAGTTELASVTTSGAQVDWNAYEPVISADARHVAFSSEATNMTSTPPASCSEYNCPNVFARDRAAGITRAVSTASPRAKTRTDGDGASRDPSVSGDGSAVAFVTSGTNFVSTDSNGHVDIAVWRRGGSFSLASISSGGRQANGPSELPALSDDGRVVAFLSEATNLVAGDTNRSVDVFVRDMARHRTTRVSVSSSGAQADGPSGALSNGAPLAPDVSADGRYVVFTSEATNLVPGDTNDASDIYVHDRATGKTSRVSVSSSEEQGNGHSYHSSISADGNRIAFDSEASNLIPNDTICGEGPSGPISCSDIFIRDLAAGTTTVVSVTNEGKVANGPSWTPAISADGRHVVFTSHSNDLAEGRDPDDFSTPVYVRDLETKDTELVGYPMEQSDVVALSFDGRFVGPMTGGGLPVSMYDRETGKNIIVSNCGSTYKGDLASGGRYLVWGWDCEQNGDRNGHMDVYIFDRQTKAITWLSKPIR